MIKSGYEVLDLINTHLLSMGIKDLISGDLYLLERLTNSDKEDIVINILALTNEQVQQGVGNCNIYVPNLQVIKQDGNIDNSQPNFDRLTELSKFVLPMFNDKRVGDYWLSLREPALPMQDNDGNYLSNISFNFNSVNKNFK